MFGVSVYPERRAGNSRRVGSFDLSRQMSLLRAATTTRIDQELSPGNITALKGETALLVCTVLNVGDKSVRLVRGLDVMENTETSSKGHLLLLFE